MKPRTEEEIIRKAPITVTFGDTLYEIKPLTILKQRAWRELLAKELAPLVEQFNQQTDRKNLLGGLAGALVDFPEKLADLVFAYCPELSKDKVLEEATEEQVAVAFSSIMTVAFPFLAQLGLVTQVVRSSANPQR